MASTQLVASVPSGIEPRGPFGHAHAGQRCDGEREGLLRRRGVGARAAAATGEEPVPGASGRWCGARACARCPAGGRRGRRPWRRRRPRARRRPGRRASTIRWALRSALALDAEGAGVDAVGARGRARAAQRALEGARVAPSRATSARLTMRSFGLPGERSTRRRGARAGGRVPADESGPRPRRRGADASGPPRRRRRAPPRVGATVDAAAAGRRRHRATTAVMRRRRVPRLMLDARHLHRCNVGNGAVLLASESELRTRARRRPSNAHGPSDRGLAGHRARSATCTAAWPT